MDGNIRRRELLLGSALALALPGAEQANASNVCGPLQCVAQVPFAQVAAKYEPQYQSEWCWAACISMVFAFYGHRVNQERIVSEVYGAPYNLPAGSGFVVARSLNRAWIDDTGRPFRSTLQAVFDVQSGVAAINNVAVISALARGFPLIVGARTHATVVTAVTYSPTPLGPNITAVGVIDPWPGIGARLLMPDEMVPIPVDTLMFLALPILSK